MLGPMEVETGVRFNLNRESSVANAVLYRVELELPESRFAGLAEVELSSGEVRLEWHEPGSPPDWCVSAVRAQLRTLYRDRATRPFPRRVTRWRARPQVEE